MFGHFSTLCNKGLISRIADGVTSVLGVFLVDFTVTVVFKFQVIALIRDCLDFLKR